MSSMNEWDEWALEIYHQLSEYKIALFKAPETKCSGRELETPLESKRLVGKPREAEIAPRQDRSIAPQVWAQA